MSGRFVAGSRGVTQPTYEPLPYESMEHTLREIGSADTGRVVRAILGAALESPDREWVEASAVSLTLVPDADVRRAAILALGHLARRFRVLSAPAVAMVIDRVDDDHALAGALADLRDDLETFGIPV
jgi:hypothetical protein